LSYKKEDMIFTDHLMKMSFIGCTDAQEVTCHVDKQHHKFWYVTPETGSFDVSHLAIKAETLRTILVNIDRASIYTGGVHLEDVNAPDKPGINYTIISQHVAVTKMISKRPIDVLIATAYFSHPSGEKANKDILYLLLTLVQGVMFSKNEPAVLRCIKCIETMIPRNAQICSDATTYPKNMYLLYLRFVEPLIAERTGVDFIQHVTKKYKSLELDVLCADMRLLHMLDAYLNE